MRLLNSCFRLILLVGACTTELRAQLTVDSIQHYLQGNWVLCTYQSKLYYFDSDSGTEEIIGTNDEFSSHDSTLTFDRKGFFTKNGAPQRKRYKISRLLNTVRSPYKIALGNTEYIFEIRDDGFILQRLILGLFDENEVHSYSFLRPGHCPKE